MYSPFDSCLIEIHSIVFYSVVQVAEYLSREAALTFDQVSLAYTHNLFILNISEGMDLITAIGNSRALIIGVKLKQMSPRSSPSDVEIFERVYLGLQTPCSFLNGH